MLYSIPKCVKHFFPVHPMGRRNIKYKERNVTRQPQLCASLLLAIIYWFCYFIIMSLYVGDI